MAAAAVRLFDFDTKLTRYDLLMLRQRANTWNERLSRAQLLVSPAERAAEIDRVFTEIVQDPAARKFLSGLGVLEKDEALQLLRDMR
jgi:3-hydroxyisobutyrate dehydrogenase-like beta-hydroxyacid dehydrogenase